MASGLVAAFIGPEVFSITKDLMLSAAYVGAYAAIAGLGCIGFLPILAFRDLSPVSAGAGAGAGAVSLRQALGLFSRSKIAIAASGAAVSQAVMVLLMAPTALAMVGCGFAEGQAADVIKWHVIAMFAPGFFTGALIQRFGVMPIITIGLAALGCSALSAMAGLELWHFYISLILTGVGWNFGFTGSTYLLQSALSAQEKPLVQGANDTLLAVVSSVASLILGGLYFGIGRAATAASVLPVIALAMGFIALRYRTIAAP
jgi:hypothetical protein